MVTFVKHFYYEEEAKRFVQEIHEALVGSPAYVNNEILLNVTRVPTFNNHVNYDVTLLVGNETDHNKTIEL